MQIATNKNYASVISLNDFRLSVNLGVPSNERSIKQEVSISFKFFFENQPQGFVTDNIKDTICYFEISQIVQHFCSKKEFQLLEFMCNGLYQEIRKAIPAAVKIWLKIEKWPAIENLHGSTSFEYSDA